MVGCLKCIEQLHEALAFFVYFLTQKNKLWQCRCQCTKAIAWLFAYFMQAQRLLTRAFGGYLAFALWVGSSDQKAQA
jgi:hypothetical protein